MGKILLAMGLAGVLVCAGPPARADEQSNDWPEQFRFRLEGLDKLMQGMDDLLRSLPRYQAPIIDDNGDIIIRRAPRQPESDPFTRPAEPDFADI